MKSQRWRYDHSIKNGFSQKWLGRWHRFAGSAAVAAFALPLKLNIIVAIVAAVAAGLLIEQAQHAARRLHRPT